MKRIIVPLCVLMLAVPLIQAEEPETPCKVSVLPTLKIDPVDARYQEPTGLLFKSEALCESRAWGYLNKTPNLQSMWDSKVLEQQKGIVTKIHNRINEVDKAVAEASKAAAAVYEAAKKNGIAELKTIELLDKSKATEITLGTALKADGKAVDRKAAILALIQQKTPPDSTDAVPGAAIQDYYKAVLKLRALLKGHQVDVGADVAGDKLEPAAMATAMEKVAGCGRTSTVCWNMQLTGPITWKLYFYGDIAHNRTASDFGQAAAVYKKVLELVSANGGNIKTLLAAVDAAIAKEKAASSDAAALELNARVNAALDTAGLGRVEELWKKGSENADWQKLNPQKWAEIQKMHEAAKKYRAGKVRLDGDVFLYESDGGIAPNPQSIKDGDFDAAARRVADEILKGEPAFAKLRATVAALQGVDPSATVAAANQPVDKAKADGAVSAGAETSWQPKSCTDSDRMQGYLANQNAAYQEDAAAMSTLRTEKSREWQEACRKVKEKAEADKKALDTGDAVLLGRDLEPQKAKIDADAKQECDALLAEARAAYLKERRARGMESEQWLADKKARDRKIVEAALETTIRDLVLKKDNIKDSYMPGGSRNGALADALKLPRTALQGKGASIMVASFFKKHWEGAADSAAGEKHPDCAQACKAKYIVAGATADAATYKTPDADSVDACVRPSLVAYFQDPKSKEEAFAELGKK